MEFCPITDAYQNAPQITGRIDILNDEHQEAIQTQVKKQISEGMFKSFILAYEDKKKNGKPTKPHYHFSYVPSYAYYQEKINLKDPIKAIRETVIKPLQQQLKKYVKETKQLISCKTNLTDTYYNIKDYIYTLSYITKQKTLHILHNEEFIQEAYDVDHEVKDEYQKTKAKSKKEALLEYLQQEQPEARNIQQLSQVCRLYYCQNDILLPPPTRFKSILIWVIYKQYPCFHIESEIAQQKMYDLI